MDPRELYKEHLDTVRKATEEALETSGHDGLVLHAGSHHHFHADDREIFPVTVPHFARFAPVKGRDHLLLVKPGETPKLARVTPRDFWYEEPAKVDHPYPDHLDVVDVTSTAEAAEAIGQVKGCAFIGDDPSVAKSLGIAAKDVEPKSLMAPLDWARAYKTEYEVECVREAGRLAAEGHNAVRDAVPGGHSERALHALYLESTGLMENDTPYTNIIGWDEHAAILHYQSKDKERPQRGHVLLIDAGAPYLGYASDITRTWIRGDVHPVFADCLDRMDALQRKLVDAVKPGKDYVELHAECHEGIAEILSATGIAKVGADECLEKGITRVFLPHGLGHHLGIQVHDVGGRQANPKGDIAPPPEAHPFLRTTRKLEEGCIVTIEPGLYFIPMLLDDLKQDGRKASIDWDLVEALIPCGGIRIEDDVLVTEEGSEDLTRGAVPGHLGG